MVEEMTQEQTDRGVELVEQVQAVQAAQREARSHLAEPEDDELGDEIVFVRNGWVRVTIAGELHKLRRPFLGELRDLELSRETDAEALKELSEEMHRKTDELLQRSREIGEESRGLNGSDPGRKRELDREATTLALEATKLSRHVVREAQDLRAKWWEQVFETLTPPPKKGRVPKQLPAWVGDAVLQERIIDHWQSSPLARGGG